MVATDAATSRILCILGMGILPTIIAFKLNRSLLICKSSQWTHKGALTPLNSTIVDGSGRWVATLYRTQESSFIHGAVMVFNAPPDESPQFPVVPAVASIVAVVAIVCVILLVFRRHRKPTINLNQ